MTNQDSPTNTQRPNSVLPKIAIAAAAIAVLAGGAFFGWKWYQESNAANVEMNAEKQETETCRQHLAAIHTAWVHYVADHKGRNPGSFADLVPKYISDAHILMCPTAERWIAKGANMQAGSLKLPGRDWPVTYGFVCFAASYPVSLRQNGDRTIMVTCSAHQEGMYQSVYHRPAAMVFFDAAQRGALNDAVRNSKLLVLRKNGTVELQAPE